MQNLVDDTRRFEKEILRPGGGANKQAQKHTDWITEMKIKLVKIDDEERRKGRGFMKRIKETWDLEFPEQASVSMHNLRNYASRFQKEPEIRNLILVRNRNEADRQEGRLYKDPSNHQIIFEYEGERDSTQNDRVHEANGLINENDNDQGLRTVIRAEDKKLENIFNQILQELEHCTMSEMHPREKIPKLKLTPDIEESANRILEEYLHGDESISDITKKVYAVGKTIAKKSGKVQRQANCRRKNMPSNGNKREKVKG